MMVTSTDALSPWVRAREDIEADNATESGGGAVGA
jgi:hypothetical protein